MDSLEIATGVLSLTAPSIEGWAGNERADMARRVNDYGAGLVQRRPDRFGFFATLALPDVDAALTEVGRAFDDRNICLDITSHDLRATNEEVRHEDCGYWRQRAHRNKAREQAASAWL